jgi:hypothetical protein
VMRDTSRDRAADGQRVRMHELAVHEDRDGVVPPPMSMQAAPISASSSTRAASPLA